MSCMPAGPAAPSFRITPQIAEMANDLLAGADEAWGEYRRLDDQVVALDVVRLAAYRRWQEAPDKAASVLIDDDCFARRPRPSSVHSPHES